MNIRRRLEQLVDKMKNGPMQNGRARRSSAAHTKKLDNIPAWGILKKKYGIMGRFHLIAFVQKVKEAYPDVPLPNRKQKRRVVRLVRFLDDHWEQFERGLDIVQFLDQDGTPIEPEDA
jgi:hypothetical protein